MAQPRYINLNEQARLGSCTEVILANGAVTAPKLAAGAVDSNALAVNSVLPSKFHSSVYGNGTVANGLTFAVDVNVDNVTLQIVTNQVKLKSVHLETFTSDPVAGNPGRLIWRSDLSQVKVDDGSSFTALGSGGGGHIIEDEGVALTQRAVLNFVGTGVTVTDGPTKTTVTIPGGSGSSTYARDSITVTNPIADHTIILSNTPTSLSEIVIWNGLVLRPGALNDYTLSGTTLTLNVGVILTIGDEIEVVYAY